MPIRENRERLCQLGKIEHGLGLRARENERQAKLGERSFLVCWSSAKTCMAGKFKSLICCTHIVVWHESCNKTNSQ